MKKALGVAGTLILVMIVAGGLYFWRGYSKFMAVEAVVIDPQLTVYTGSGNTVVLTSADGASALVIDTKMKSSAEKLRNNIRAKNITIINTHAHFDHVGGNALFPNAATIAGSYAKDQWDKDSRKSCQYPAATLKPGEEKIMTLDDETVHILNMGRAHTYNDVVVYLEKRKLLAAGDLVFYRMHPAVIAESGTKISLWINALDALSQKYDIQTLVPGHGSLAGRNALADMKDYFITVGNCADIPEKQTLAKEKYKTYITVPGLFSFGNTLKFIEQERKEAN